MLEFKTVTKTYQTEEVSRCVCDRCGKECEKKTTTDNEYEMRSLIEINPKYVFEEFAKIDLCPECTEKLLDWLGENCKPAKDLKEGIEWLKNAEKDIFK